MERCDDNRKAFKECFMIKTDCRKELDELFKCIHETHYYFPIIPPKHPINSALIYERSKVPPLR